jgi:3-hydroxybutyryl-CoA dehydratase
VTDQWPAGTELARLTRTMTAERMRWYSDALETLTAGASHLLAAGPNIHTDDDVAKANGLSGRVADGMISTNWISTLLADTFGDAYLAGGSLRTRYVRPIYEDERIEVVVKIVGVEYYPNGERLTADVVCLKPDGEVATAGVATVRAEDGPL